MEKCEETDTMTSKVLVILGGDLDAELIPKYRQAAEQGTMKIVGFARLTKQGIALEPPADGGVQLQYILISVSKMYPYLEYIAKAVPNLPTENIIDGRIFRMPGLDVPRLFAEHRGYASLHELVGDDRTEEFWDVTRANIQRTWHRDSRTVELGPKTYFAGKIEWGYRVSSPQKVSFGSYTSCAWDITLELGLNNQHDYHRVSVYDPGCLDWSPWQEVGYTDTGGGIRIGSDVWIGRGCRLKSAGDSGILTIGDGAVIASDSVVVKDVPPFAIVGGNPAKVIKYRFDPDVIEGLLKVRWWDWDMKRIHDNMKWFKMPRKFLQNQRNL